MSGPMDDVHGEGVKTRQPKNIKIELVIARYLIGAKLFPSRCIKDAVPHSLSPGNIHPTVRVILGNSLLQATCELVARDEFDLL